MPRRWLQARLPARALLNKQLGIGGDGTPSSWLGQRLADSALWHLNRRSVAGGVAVGLFISWVPIPLQMVLAACVAAVMRVHVPVSVVMVWFSNPLTFAPLLYLAWRVGSIVTGPAPVKAPFTWSIEALYHGAINNWPEVLIGTLICASITAIIGYAATHLIWRMNVVRQRRSRQRGTSWTDT